VSTKPLHVMLVCERLDLAGGVERFSCELANHLASVGLQVSLAGGSAPGAPLKYPLDGKVALLHGGLAAPADRPGPGRRLALACHQWQLGRRLAALARQADPEVLILNGLTTACAFLLAAPGLAARCICCDHNHFEARSRPWRWLRRALYPRVAAVVSLSEADRPRYAALQSHTVVIPNASSLAAATPADVASPTVLAVGRHVAQKGFDLLLQAWAEVLRQVPAARLRIVGEGDLQGALQAQAASLHIADSVAWVAPTPRIADEYRAAAVFVLPSRYEGMPLALLEAQALGVPAVAFDCPTGPREVLGEDTGLLVPPADVGALAQALVRLLGDMSLRQRMGRAAIARSQALFSPARHAEGWTALVRRVGAGA
jgi:glycosyltransferase involved in cell wall biosynthesis